MSDPGFSNDWWGRDPIEEAGEPPVDEIERTADCALRYLEELLERAAYDEVREILQRISLQLPQKRIAAE